MKLVTLDFETYYDSDYSLSRMTTEEYINDPRFEIIGASVAVEGGEPMWRSFPDLASYRAWLSPLRSNCVTAHNMMFDGAILGWRLGIHPRFLMCTLAQSRAVDGPHLSHSLAQCAERRGLPPKGTEVIAALGKHRAGFTPAELDAYGAYCRHDVELCRALVRDLAPRLGQAELRKMNTVLQMYTHPVLQLDRDLLQQEYDAEETEKTAMLARVARLKGDFSSAARFAHLLTDAGVAPPVKPSLKKKLADGSPALIWAFAKSDPGMQALLEHDDPVVVALAEARLKIQSPQRQTRAQRLLGIEERNHGLLPVPLAIAAAHTHRLGGTDKINLQNLPRARKGDPASGLLRKSICAPPGHALVVGDLAQIEARILCLLAGDSSRLAAFEQGRDVYSEQASVIFGRHVDGKNNPDDFLPRFVGKAVVLGAGYQLGHITFGARIWAGMLGMTSVRFDEAFGAALGADRMTYQAWLAGFPEMEDRVRKSLPAGITEDAWFAHLAAAKKIIEVFRQDNPQIVSFWGQCKMAIDAMAAGSPFAFGSDILVTEPEGIRLPNGLALRYPDLRCDENGEYSCLRRRSGRVERARVYPGVITENVCQALTAIIIGDAMNRISAHAGWRVVLQAHDEIGVVVPQEEAVEAEPSIRKLLCVPPAWAPTLPIEAEVSTGVRYGDCK